MEKTIIAAIDVGTTKVCTLIGQKTGLPKEHHYNSHDDNGKDLEIIGIGGHPSFGLKKGAVVNIDQTIKSIQSSVEEASLMAGVKIDKATIGIAGNHIFSFNSTGVVASRGLEITEDDVNRAIEAAKAVIIPSDREIIHVIPQEFKVDSIGGIKNPVGMRGVRLEVFVHIVTGNISLIQNLIKCIEEAGVYPEQVILQPLASSESVISPEEKELGVILVDIGGGTTDIACWKNGGIVHTQVIPVGGNHFTNDLAVALRVPFSEAERIKLNHGSVLMDQKNIKEMITVQGITGTKAREVPLNYITNVLSARADELIQIIKDIIKDRDLDRDLSGGVIFTGGGAQIDGLLVLADHVLSLPIKLGLPQELGGMTKVIQGPKFSTVLGLLIEADRNSRNSRTKENSKHLKDLDIITKLGNSLKAVFKELF